MATIRTIPGVRGTRYSVQIRTCGVSESKTFSTRTVAKEWAKRRELELKEQPHLAGTQARKRTLAQAIDRYIRDYLPERSASQQRNARTQLAWWSTKLGHLPLHLVQAPLLVEARDELRRRLSPASVNRHLSALGAVLTAAAKEWHWLPSSPMGAVSRLKEPQGRTRFLSTEVGPDGTSELSRLLDACRISESPLLYEAVLMALTTGGRRMEVLGLTWGDLDLENLTVTLSGQKTGHRRTVALSPVLAGLLRPRRGLPKALVFPSDQDPGRPTDPRTAFETACRRAGVSDFRWHDLRHCAASYLAMQGASLAEIASVLGHKGLVMVQRYSHLSREHTARASARIGEHIGLG